MSLTVPQHLKDGNATSPASATPAAPAVAAVVGANQVLQAQTLLAGRPWVGIEHNGQQYRLQTTRAGKLILTK